MQLAHETTHLVQSYTLPDGRSIKVGAERFMAPEAIFRPELVDVETEGISDVVFNCIQVRSIPQLQLYSQARHFIVLPAGHCCHKPTFCAMEVTSEGCKRPQETPSVPRPHLHGHVRGQTSHAPCSA